MWVETEGPLKETNSLRYLKRFKNSSKVLQRDYRERLVILIVKVVSMESGTKADYLGVKMEVALEMCYLKGIRVSSNWKEGLVKCSGFREFAVGSFQQRKTVLPRRKTSSKWEMGSRIWEGGGDGVGTLKTVAGGADWPEVPGPPPPREEGCENGS